MQLPVSVVMIVKNEEAFLAASLGSVANHVSEMIVFDTGSTDRSREIAKGLGARIESYSWDHDFSAARNYAASLATHDWIFFLDGDEIVSAQAWDELARLLTDSDIAAYGILQRNYAREPFASAWTYGSLPQEIQNQFPGLE